MVAGKSGRGRPKGSGLDDRKTLDALSELLARNPELKPTTAIKALGISEPSSIRRLRDKLKAERTAMAAAGDMAHETTKARSAGPATIRTSYERRRVAAARSQAWRNAYKFHYPITLH